MTESLAERNAARRATIIEFGFFQYIVGQVVGVDGTGVHVAEADLLAVDTTPDWRVRQRGEFPAQPLLAKGARYMIVGYADDHAPPSGIEIRDIIVSTELFTDEFPESDALHSTFA
jgi:hypothetical protein